MRWPLSLALLAAWGTAADPLPRDTTGFYPIWEVTGHVEPSGTVRAGTNGLQVGIADLAHAGVQPLQFAVRTPNAYLKLALARSPRWRVAAQAGAYRLLEGASRTFFSPMYSSRLDNPDFPVTLVPLAVSASVEVFGWLEVHQALTGLLVTAPGYLRTQVTAGYSVVGELNPRARHGISLHLAEVGFWAHDLLVAGASYRYRNGWLDARLGYFYRFGKAGAQAAPLASLGLIL